MTVASNPNSHDFRRAGYFTLLLVVVNLVGDGGTRRPLDVTHQLMLLPATAFFLASLIQLLRPQPHALPIAWTPRRSACLTLLFEVAFVALYLYECHHFAAFGYQLHPIAVACVFSISLLTMAYAIFRSANGLPLLGASLIASTGGLLLAIASFPLNFMRSDMLPVIFWADRSLRLHTDPYITLRVAQRFYDFPYLPGMMLAFYPAAAVGVDLRFVSILCTLLLAGLIFWAAKPQFRPHVAALIALFILCPFLQFRHDLYLQPHWLSLVAAFILMQRRHFASAAVIFGISMAIYQFSWILFPFFVLNAFRRKGWTESIKLACIGLAVGLLVMAPFLRSASHRIVSNTVGQWGRLVTHAIAEPMNLSFWATYIIHPEHLLRLQAALMVAIFLYCCLRNRCADLTDTLRWMIIALTIFVLFNVLVDGYFFLMLLVPMLVYTCVANGWLADPASHYINTLPSTARQQAA